MRTGFLTRSLTVRVEPARKTTVPTSPTVTRWIWMKTDKEMFVTKIPTMTGYRQ